MAESLQKERRLSTYAPQYIKTPVPVDAINASSELIDTGVIAPKKLAEFMDNYSKENNNIIKISNPQEFITNLLKILNNEKQEK